MTTAIIRNRPRTSRLVEAIQSYDTARDAFIAMAVDAGDLAGDPTYDANFADAEQALATAEFPLLNLLQGYKPAVWNDRVYSVNRFGKVERRDVQVIEGN